MDLLNIKCEFTDASMCVIAIMVLLMLLSFYGSIFGGLCFENYKVAIISIICFIIGAGTLFYINGNKDKYKETIAQYYVKNESLIPIYAKKCS